MGKRLMAAVVLVGAAQMARADSVSIGYSPVPVQRKYVSDDYNAPPNNQVQHADAFSPATIQVLYTVERKVRDTFNMTLTTGIGVPMGTAKFDASKQVTNLPAVSDNSVSLVGNSEEVSVFTVPVLVGGKYLIPTGDNLIALGVSFGAMLIGTSTVSTVKSWSGTAGAQTESGSVVTYDSSVSPAWALLGSVGYNIKMGEGESVGITVPFGIISQVRMDTETKTVGPGAGMLGTSNDGWLAGGFTYGIQVGWNKSF